MTVGSSKSNAYVGIWNTTKNLEETVVKRERSSLIQHKDALTAFVNASREKNLETKGILKNHGGRVIVLATFSGLSIKDDTGKNIDLGVRLENNYGNSGPTFKGEGFGIMSMCENGMIFGNLLATVFKKHEKLADLTKLMIEFVDNITDKATKISEVISLANKDVFENRVQMEETVLGEVGSKKKARSIIELIEERNQFTRYSVVNALTNYAEHQSQNEKERVTLNRLAMRVLVKNREELKRESWEE